MFRPDAGVAADWSILICTLVARRPSFERLRNKLRGQVTVAGLDRRVEILSLADEGEAPIGTKRNWLVAASRGKYVSFVDDDDDVHDNYVGLIHAKLRLGPDCVGLVGVITVDGGDPRRFVHSIRYDRYFERDGVYYRPPNHLNPMRRDVACRFSFPDRSRTEDTAWALQVARSGLLRREEAIDEPYYFYRYSTHKPERPTPPATA